MIYIFRKMLRFPKCNHDTFSRIKCNYVLLQNLLWDKEWNNVIFKAASRHLCLQSIVNWCLSTKSWMNFSIFLALKRNLPLSKSWTCAFSIILHQFLDIGIADKRLDCKCDLISPVFCSGWSWTHISLVMVNNCLYFLQV